MAKGLTGGARAGSVPRFSDFEGQTALLEPLAKDFQAGRFAHAYLFLGPDGVGKFSVAKLCAMAAVCRHGAAAKAQRAAAQADSLLAGLEGAFAQADEPAASVPCGVCGPCVRVQSLTHPDVRIIEVIRAKSPNPREYIEKNEDDDEAKKPSKTFSVDEMRVLIKRVQLRAFEGGAKVVVLHDADSLNLSAQNCLLKTLEEPPRDVCFILVAKTQSALLPTILSRCRIVRFHPLSEEAAQARLRALGMDPLRVGLLAHLSEGRVGAALSMAQDEAYFALLHRVDQTIFSLRSASDIPVASAPYKEEKDSAERIFDIAEQLFRDAMRMQLTGERRTELGYSRAFDSYVQKAGVDASIRMLRALQQARQMRSSNVSFFSIWESILLSVAEEHQKWQW